jgi:hypothetical protein
LIYDTLPATRLYQLRIMGLGVPDHDDVPADAGGANCAGAGVRTSHHARPVIPGRVGASQDDRAAPVVMVRSLFHAGG